MANTNTTTQASDIVLAILLEIGGLAIVTAVAGINDQIANLMIVLMIGITLLWMFTHTSQMSAIQNLFTRVEKAAGQ